MIKKIRPVIRVVQMDGEVRRFMDRIFRERRGLGELEDSWVPAIDVFERRDHLVVEVEVPGLKAGEIVLGLVPSRIEIKGVKREAPLASDGRYLRLERGYGAFARTIPQPCAVVTEGAKARLENGVLTVVLRKLRPGRDREVRIPIRKSESEGGRS
jgi:HSP20 family protein